MKRFFMDSQVAVERWKFASAFVGVAVVWFVVLAASFGII